MLIPYVYIEVQTVTFVEGGLGAWENYLLSVLGISSDLAIGLKQKVHHDYHNCLLLRALYIQIT